MLFSHGMAHGDGLALLVVRLPRNTCCLEAAGMTLLCAEVLHEEMRLDALSQVWLLWHACHACLSAT